MDRMIHSVSRQVLWTLSGANSSTKGCSVIVGSGDLHQMGVQAAFLRAQGMTVGHVDVYPSVRTEEEKLQAMRLLWEYDVEGWWNLDLVRAGICTDEEFHTRLKERIARSKESTS